MSKSFLPTNLLKIRPPCVMMTTLSMVLIVFGSICGNVLVCLFYSQVEMPLTAGNTYTGRIFVLHS